MTRRELNIFERKTHKAERGQGDGPHGRGVMLAVREARDLVEYIQWLERAVEHAAERSADGRQEADLFSVIAR